MSKRPKFLAAENLARLAKWLRFLGYDTELYRAVGFNNKLRILKKDGRIYLTRCGKEAGSNIAFARKLIRSGNHLEQLREIIDFVAIDQKRIFTRCSICNSGLYDIKKEKIRELIPDYIYENHEEYRICRKCGKIYWKGSHFLEMKKTLEQIFKKIG